MHTHTWTHTWTHTCMHVPFTIYSYARHHTYTYQCDMFSKDFQDKVEHLDEFCKDKGFHAWFQTSAKEDTGIDEAVRCLAAKVC